MFLLAVLLASTAVGLLAGGRLRGLLLERLRWIPLLPAWMALSVLPAGLVLAGFADWPTGDALIRLRTAYVSLLLGLPALFLALNLLPPPRNAPAWRLPLRAADAVGIVAMLLGVFAQGAVMLANGAVMPVHPDVLARLGNPAAQYGLSAGLYLDRALVGPDTVLPWLARTIPLPLAPIDPPFLSPGEIAVAVGLCILVLSLMRPYDRWKASAGPVIPPRPRNRRPRRGRRRS